MKNADLTVVDLFCGVGGFSEGAVVSPKYAFRVIAGVDRDDTLRTAWKLNRPDSLFLSLNLASQNLNEVWNSTKKLGIEAGSFDVLVASPPCQKLSAAGKRDPSDPTNSLYVSVIRAVERWKPKILLLENVVRFFTASEEGFLQACQRGLRDAGYISQWAVLNAASYGVPQFRRRGFLVAVGRESFRGLALFPSSTHSPQLIGDQDDSLIGAKQLRPTPNVEDAIGDLPSLQAGEGSEPLILEEPPSSDFQRERRSGGRGEVFNHRAWGHSDEMVTRIESIGEGEAPQHHNVHPVKPRVYFRQAYARLHRKEPAHTITTNFHNPGSGRFIHYRDHRTLTVREAARLQTFDDRFRFIGTQSETSIQVGNAVPPLMARVLLEHLAELVI